MLVTVVERYKDTNDVGRFYPEASGGSDFHYSLPEEKLGELACGRGRLKQTVLSLSLMLYFFFKVKVSRHTSIYLLLTT
ncbi:hypothetical protein GCM10008083_23420 [Ulvibacter litoralis]|nr:hypothetical protein GCM10008083_23420 [Ulvibacter litoralis]